MGQKKRRDWTWVQHITTDDDNTTYDSGRIALFYIVFGVVTFVIVIMCGLQVWDVVVNKTPFKPNDLGIGVGGLLGGVAGVLVGVGAYLFGQRKGETVPTIIQTTGVSNGNEEASTSPTKDSQGTKGKGSAAEGRDADAGASDLQIG